MTVPPQFTLTISDLAALIGADDVKLEGTEVVFKPNIIEGEVMPIEDSLYRVESVRGVINANGELEDLAGNPGVVLLANDPVLNLDEPLQWQVSFSHVDVNGFTRKLLPWWFEAPSDGETVDLRLLAHVPGTTATGTTTITLEGVPLAVSTLAEFNAALSDGDFCSLAGSETLTNKTIDGASNTLSNIPQSAVTNLTTDLSGKEPTITAGTAGQYWRGDKSWQTLDKTAVGLGNVDNTSDATKDAATATLTNKTISGASNTLSNIGNGSLSNSAITIAGTSTSLGGSISQDTITGLSTTGLVKRTAANTLGIGSAGTDYVAPGGALGTPSSGTLTNCTGLPVAGITASTSTALGVGSIEVGHASDTTLSRVSAGVLAVEGVTLADVSSAQSLSNKTIASPTVSGTIAGTYTLGGTPTFPSSVVTATVNSSGKVIGSGAAACFTPSSTFLIPGLHNDIAACVERGGAVTVTKNAVSASPSTGSVNDLFNNRGFVQFDHSSTSDVYVITVDLPTPYGYGTGTFQYANTYGIITDDGGGGMAKDVTIEAYISGGWVNIHTVTNQTSGAVWKMYGDPGGVAPTKIRYTLTNLSSASRVRILSVFLVNYASGMAASGYMSRTGGAIFGTNAAPPTFTATSADSNVSINMVPKGSGTLNVSGVPVVTTTGTATLTGKTLTSPTMSSPTISDGIIKDSNGNTVLKLVPTAAATNYLTINNDATAGNPAILCQGSNGNISFTVLPKGSGSGLKIYTSTGNSAKIVADGVDSNVDLSLASKGSGKVKINSVDAVDVSSAQTITGKTVNLTSNTLSGTTAEFNAALSDGDFATLTGAETLTSKTLTEPKLSTATPASASATGTTGTIVWDTDYIYIAVGTDTWKRAAISTWP